MVCCTIDHFHLRFYVLQLLLCDTLTSISCLRYPQLKCKHYIGKFKSILSISFTRCCCFYFDLYGSFLSNLVHHYVNYCCQLFPDIKAPSRYYFVRHYLILWAKKVGVIIQNLLFLILRLIRKYFYWLNEIQAAVSMFRNWNTTINGFMMLNECIFSPYTGKSLFLTNTMLLPNEKAPLKSSGEINFINLFNWGWRFRKTGAFINVSLMKFIFSSV